MSETTLPSPKSCSGSLLRSVSFSWKNAACFASSRASWPSTSCWSLVRSSGLSAWIDLLASMIRFWSVANDLSWSFSLPSSSLVVSGGRGVARLLRQRLGGLLPVGGHLAEQRNQLVEDVGLALLQRGRAQRRDRSLRPCGNWSIWPRARPISPWTSDSSRP